MSKHDNENQNENPPGVEKIGVNAFSKCGNLTSVTLPRGSVKTLNGAAFDDTCDINFI